MASGPPVLGVKVQREGFMGSRGKLSTKRQIKISDAYVFITLLLYLSIAIHPDLNFCSLTVMKTVRMQLEILRESHKPLRRQRIVRAFCTFGAFFWSSLLGLEYLGVYKESTKFGDIYIDMLQPELNYLLEEDSLHFQELSGP